MAPGAAVGALASAPCLLVMLDYDGTLSPIARTPAEARPLPGTDALLERLAQLPGTLVAVISGRAIDDLSGRVRCEGIVLFGNHGLQCQGLPVTLPVPMAVLLDRARRLQADLADALSGVDGVMIENKGPVISVHYRQADPRRTVDILNRVRRTARGHPGFRSVMGKRVVELRPDLPVDKGTAVRDLIDEARRRWGCEPLSLYAGDDTTDEDAFRAVGHGMTILVGEERPTRARHRVGSPEELAKFLEELERLRRARMMRGVERDAWNP